MTMRTILPRLLLLLALCCVSGAALADDSRPKAPDFTLRTLTGERVKLSDYKGKVVLLNFWATWCAPCKQELPILQALLDKHGKDKLAVLAVNIDDPKTIAEVRRFVADKKFTMPVPLDEDSKVLGKFNPRHALPFLQVIDADGRRAYQHTGFTTGAEKALEQQVLGLFSEKTPALANP
jgi:thiol-disulfide isomerase/thioredoxin